MSQRQSPPGCHFVFLVEARPDGTGAERVAWHIVAANRRRLGRSALTYPSMAESARIAQRLHDAAATTTGATFFDSVARQWSWQVSLDDAVIAVNVHPYRRRIECARSLDHFLAAAQAADPRDGTVRHLAGRSLRAAGTVQPHVVPPDVAHSVVAHSVVAHSIVAHSVGVHSGTGPGVITGPNGGQAHAPGGSALTVSYAWSRTGPVECRWQLGSGNGRVLGRSAGQFPDERSAHEEFRNLVARADRLRLFVVHAHRAAGWTWRIEDADNRAVIRSHRTYERHDSCDRSGRRVLAALQAHADASTALQGEAGPPAVGRTRPVWTASRGD